MLDELKEIEQIISKLDSVNPEDWNKKENETQEEFEERIKNIEEEIEEELIDVISDSLLNEQKIDEEEAVKEAREKIEKEYEIYQDAFEKDSNGKITLKSKEELLKLGYKEEDEIEKLTTIVDNYNDPETYIENIRKSIHTQKDIDAEIERKMEIAKTYISAKIRGEEPVVPTNEPKVKKYEENNNYIVATSYLNRVPLVQNEMINNSRLIAKNYIPYTPRVQNNNSVQTKTNATTSQITANSNVKPKTTSVNSVKVQVLRNIENKMDSTNDLSKQKIKARTELKMVLKEYENKELDENEFNELKLKIDNIEKKYPNIVTNKLIEKISKEFNVEPIKIDESSKITVKGAEKIEQQDKNDIVPKMTELKAKNTGEFDGRREEILNIIAKFNESKAVLNMSERYIFFIADYLKNNDDEYVRNNLNEMILKLENQLKGDFAKEFIEKDIDFNIGILDYLYQLYNDENGKGVVIPDKQKAKEFLHKELNYFAELRNNVYSDNNTIEHIKNEAKYSEALERLKRSKLSAKIPVMPLIINYELTRRNKKTYQKTYQITEIIDSYKKKIEKNIDISEIELDELGRIVYEGIKDLLGNIIIEPDKILAKSIYEKLITDYGNKKAETNYNRLYALYSDKTLPIYDEVRANKLKEIMKQKGIKIKKEDKPKDKQKEYSSKTYVCSDLHGEYDTYQAIIKKLSNNDKLYILGDVIDRGPDGIKILQDIMKRKENGQIEFIVGNHEIMMMKSLFFNDKKERENWEQNNDGDVTRKSFEKLSIDEQNKIKEFILDSYVYKNIIVNSQQVHLVHAKAIQPENENGDKTVRELLREGKMDMIEEAVWWRNNLKTEKKNIAKKGTFTIIGHTPTESKMIEYKEGYLDIDCGAAYEERESLVDLQNGTVQYFNVREERTKEMKNR